VPNFQKKQEGAVSEHESSSSNRVYSDEDDCSYIGNSEMDELEDESEANSEQGQEQEQESFKEQSEHTEGFDYICPPTVKWLLYPDDDDEEEGNSRKFLITLF
jgi:hypothetical protein